MSLDVYLTLDKNPRKRSGSGIFVRESGSVKEISLEEWDAKFPGQEPVVDNEDDSNEVVYWANITHNLGEMASKAGIYYALWRPEEIGITKASELIEHLVNGLILLKHNPEGFKRYNAENGWGLYENFVPFVEAYLEACKENPEATIRVSR